MTIQIVQNEVADEVLSTNAFALLCGMLLQQEVPVDVAFAGPATILDRFGSLDPKAIAEAPEEDFAALCAAEPAIHPYPESMSVVIQAVARYVVVNYGGDTASVWETAGSGEHLLSRLMLMPGFSKRRARIFTALLAKQLGVRPEGWEQVAGPYGEPDSYRSVADIRDAESLEKVRSAMETRWKGSDEAEDDTEASSTSAHNNESRGLTHVNTDDEREAPTEETTGPRGKKKAAVKAAKRAAIKQRREAEDLADPAGADGRAAKRAERRAARVASREGGGGGGKGGGKGGGGKGGGGKGGGGKGGGGQGGGQRRAGGAGTDAPAAGSADAAFPEED